MILAKRRNVTCYYLHYEHHRSCSVIDKSDRGSLTMLGSSGGNVYSKRREASMAYRHDMADNQA